MDEKMREEVKKAIEELRPQIKGHGGDVEFISVENGIVKVKLTGACVGCPMSQMTLQFSIGRYLQQKIPGIQKVEAV